MTGASTQNSEQEATEKTYRAIGRFMFEFSQTEHAVRHFVGEEIHLNEQHFSAVMESYDTAMLIGVAIEVFKKSRGDEANELGKLLNRFRGMNDERKRVAHGLWVPFMDGGTVHYTSRNKLTPASFAKQAAHLEKMADELCGLRAAFEREAYSVLNFRRYT